MIGDGIKLARKRVGITQIDLAKKIKSKQATLSFIETNKHRPSAKMLEKISYALDVPIPILYWLGFKREEISDEKKEIYDILKPSIDEAMEQMWKTK